MLIFCDGVRLTLVLLFANNNDSPVGLSLCQEKKLTGKWWPHSSSLAVLCNFLLPASWRTCGMFLELFQKFRLVPFRMGKSLYFETFR